MGRIGGIFRYIGIMDDMLDTKEDFGSYAAVSTG